MKKIFFFFMMFSVSQIFAETVKENQGIIYILTNQAYQEKGRSKEKLIKIGQSKDEKSLSDRVKDLSRPTGVPHPYEIFYSAKVKNYKKIEKEIHKFLDAYRSNNKREFFKWIRNMQK